MITSSSRGGDEKSGGVRSHWASSSAPSCGDVEALLRTLLSAAVVGLDQAVTLETLQGRIDLPDVERPDLAGPGLEFLPQLEPVLRPFAQEGQQGVADAHEITLSK